MNKVFVALALMAFSATASQAAYNYEKAQSRKPAVVKAASATGHVSGKAGRGRPAGKSGAKSVAHNPAPARGK